MSSDRVALHEGGLRIKLERSAQGLRAVRIVNSRPLAARMLVGRTVCEAVALVPKLFSLCASAQAIAASAACRAAGAAGLMADEAGADESAIAREAVQEHLWRLLLDWPPLLGRASQGALFASIYRRLRLSPVTSGDIEALGDAVLEIAERLRAELPQVLEDVLDPCVAPAETVPLLPQLAATDWAARLGGVPDKTFQRAPTLGGPCETGALARHIGAAEVVHALARNKRVSARLRARLVDLAECARRLAEPRTEGLPARVSAAPIGADTGLACVETARGTLLHIVRLERGCIADYAVVAPTEWNFHPQGAFVHEIRAGECDGDNDERRARALALALDPCVNFDLLVTGVSHA